mgnify:CR=1 FL=1
MLQHQRNTDDDQDESAPGHPGATAAGSGIGPEPSRPHVGEDDGYDHQDGVQPCAAGGQLPKEPDDAEKCLQIDQPREQAGDEPVRWPAAAAKDPDRPDDGHHTYNQTENAMRLHDETDATPLPHPDGALFFPTESLLLNVEDR